MEPSCMVSPNSGQQIRFTHQSRSLIDQHTMTATGYLPSERSINDQSTTINSIIEIERWVHHHDTTPCMPSHCPRKSSSWDTTWVPKLGSATHCHIHMADSLRILIAVYIVKSPTNEEDATISQLYSSMPWPWPGHGAGRYPRGRRARHGG